MPRTIRMRRYDIMMILIAVIWLWVILTTVAVFRATSPAQEIAILEIDGAIATILTLWLKRSSFVGTAVHATSSPPKPPRA